MKTLFTIILLMIAKCSFCCYCGLLPDFKSKEDLKEYDFIALVKITAVSPLDTADHYMHTRMNGEITINVLELFKGKNINLVNDPSFKSDCNLNLQTGEQWFFFGSIREGKMEVSRCSYTSVYRDIKGQREWKYLGAIKQLDVLRSIYQHPLISNMVNKQLYPDGSIEVEQYFKNGKLDGTRKIYYPNGKLNITEDFKNGIRVGHRNFYGPSGQMLRSVEYENNLIKLAIDYQDTTENAWYLNYQIHNNKKDLLFGDSDHDSTFFVKKLDSLRNLKNWDKKIQTIFTYSNDGRSYKMNMYDYLGNPEADNYVDYDKQISEYHRFYKNGKLEEYMKQDQLKNQQVEYDYNEAGVRRDFIDTCKSCKFYFARDLPPAAKAEDVYIQ
jgi:antitoxin component YwqK of YwqJK toxin-antitoxin module